MGVRQPTIAAVLFLTAFGCATGDFGAPSRGNNTNTDPVGFGDSGPGDAMFPEEMDGGPANGDAGAGDPTGGDSGSGDPTGGDSGSGAGDSPGGDSGAGDGMGGNGTGGDSPLGGDSGPGTGAFFDEIYACTGTQNGTVLHADPTNYLSQRDAMQPGDTLRMAPGIYTQGLRLFDFNGSPNGNCYTFEGADRDTVILEGRGGSNTIDIRNSSYVVLQNFSMDGKNIANIDAVKSGGYAADVAHHITVANLKITGHGATQSTVGISTKISGWYWWIHDNEIINAGTGLYMGNSDGSRPFVASLIESNVVVNPRGYGMQIKHQNSYPNLAGLPTHRTFTIIRDNFFGKASNANGGGNARPNLLVGHWPLSGSGEDNYYMIYGNVFYENTVGEALLQAEGNFFFYNNLLANNSGRGLHIRPHNDKPRSIRVFSNTIVSNNNGIHVSGVETGYSVEVVGNVIYSASPLTGGNQIDNITGTYSDANMNLVAPYGTPGVDLDMHPVGTNLNGPIDLSTIETQDILDWDVDFGGNPRSTGADATRGAYQY